MIKKANIELKDTIQKMMESHLAEKKRMVSKFEEETINYSKYHTFFNENINQIHKIEKYQQIVEENDKVWCERKKLEEQIKQLQMKLNHETSRASLTSSLNWKWSEFEQFWGNLKTKLMDSLHEIMRNDKSDTHKISTVQNILITILNEVKFCWKSNSSTGNKNLPNFQLKNKELNHQK